MKRRPLRIMTFDLASCVPRLKRLLPRFRKLRMAVLGDAMLDRYVWGEATRLSPEAAVQAMWPRILPRWVPAWKLLA